MKRFLYFYFALFLAPGLAMANVADYLDRVVLVQRIGETGKVEQQHFEKFELDPGSGRFSPAFSMYNLFGTFGICLYKNGADCKKEITTKEEADKAFARFTGKRLASAPVLSAEEISLAVTTTIENESTNSISIRVQQYLPKNAGYYEYHFRIQDAGEIGQIGHHFLLPAADAPKRKSILEVNTRQANVALAVVQMNTHTNQEQLFGSELFSGTGFFISKDGLLLTNHHVIEVHSECMSKLVCEVDFQQTIATGERRKFSARVKVLFTDKPYDVALLKVELPAQMAFTFFNIEKNMVGPEIVTLGYPGDRVEKREIQLTYSFGKLVGFHNRGYALSAHVFPGASGSPVLNIESMGLVAIISRTAVEPMAGIGSPGYAVPISLVNERFGLRDYISGAKAARVKNQVDSINRAESAQAVAASLSAFLGERTYLGINSLKTLMLEHRSPEVRASIRRTLERMNVVLGSSES